MVDFSALIQRIEAAVYENGVQAITGQILQDCLKDVVNTVNVQKQDAIYRITVTVDGTTGAPSGTARMDDETYTLELSFSGLKGETGPAGPKGDTPVLTADEDGTIYADGVLLTEVVKDVKEAVESAERSRATAETRRAEQAASDHTRAETDHTRAETDHTRAEEAAAAAEHMVDIKQGPQGPQGNTGANVDYPYELVNNLTTDDATKGLSAAQGVVLEGEVSQLSQKVDELGGEIDGGTFPKNLTWSDGYVNTGGKIMASTASKFTQPFILKKGEKVTVGTNNTNICIIGTTTANSLSVGDTITWLQITGGVAQFETHTLTATEDINLVLCVKWSDYSVSFEKTIPITKRVEDLEAAVYGSDVETTTFSVTPGTAHSSTLDKINIAIPFGEDFYVYFKASNAVSQVAVYAKYKDGTDSNIGMLAPGKAAKYTAEKEVIGIGIFVSTGWIKQSGTLDFYACQDSGLSELTAVMFNTIGELGDSISEGDIQAYGFNSVYNTIDITAKCKEYSASLNNSGPGEQLIFMTDPHLLGSSWSETTFKAYIGLLQKYYNILPVDWLVCGGDWLTAGDTQDNACWKLGYVDATMRKLFKHYYPLLGNHDTNYQGVVSADDSSRGDLSHQTLVNLMFRENKNTYYEWKGNNTRFFVLDAGIDWTPQMDSFRWEQIAWLAGLLLSNTDDHIVLLTHIYYNSGTTPAAMADNLQLLAGAFNGRTSVTLNGVTYDFSNTQGTIHCIIAGHTHADYIIEENVNVPVWITTNMQDGNTPTFDLLLIDYTAGKMKSIRVGTGEDREMTLA